MVVAIGRVFFFQLPATTDLSTLSLHDALPILVSRLVAVARKSASRSALGAECVCSCGRTRRVVKGSERTAASTPMEVSWYAVVRVQTYSTDKAKECAAPANYTARGQVPAAVVG